jgi:hypothetical protein
LGSATLGNATLGSATLGATLGSAALGSGALGNNNLGSAGLGSSGLNNLGTTSTLNKSAAPFKPAAQQHTSPSSQVKSPTQSSAPSNMFQNQTSQSSHGFGNKLHQQSHFQLQQSNQQYAQQQQQQQLQQLQQSFTNQQQPQSHFSNQQQQSQYSQPQQQSQFSSMSNQQQLSQFAQQQQHHQVQSGSLASHHQQQQQQSLNIQQQHSNKGGSQKQQQQQFQSKTNSPFMGQPPVQNTSLVHAQLVMGMRANAPNHQTNNSMNNMNNLNNNRFNTPIQRPSNISMMSGPRQHRPGAGNPGSSTSSNTAGRPLGRSQDSKSSPAGNAVGSGSATSAAMKDQQAQQRAALLQHAQSFLNPQGKAAAKVAKGGENIMVPSSEETSNNVAENKEPSAENTDNAEIK